MPGDVLVGRDGQRVPVEGVADTGRVETVYNMEVEADHTYFVGGDGWGFDLWSHNAGCGHLAGGINPLHHNANVQVRNSLGQLVSHQRVVSGNQTPFEKALGFPRGMLASHTEARAVRRIAAEPGGKIIITGQKRPCPSCRGYMNSAAEATGAAITYRWRDGGVTKIWRAGH